MSEWVDFILKGLLGWSISFGLGLLARKKIGRFLVRTKKKLFNDPVTMRIVSIRLYNPVEVHDFNQDVFENVRVRITNPKLHDFYPGGMRIEIPVFGILRLGLDRITDQEEDRLESIKVTLQLESPIRLGMRDIPLLNDYAQTAEVLFSAVENLFMTHSTLRQNYTILELPRVGRFVEEKAFEMKDDNLGAHVQATPNKLTIVVEPPIQMAKAAKKYVLV